jgi:hypothetical protein
MAFLDKVNNLDRMRPARINITGSFRDSWTGRAVVDQREQNIVLCDDYQSLTFISAGSWWHR